jgi:drug/metabolite transporter (DMT)-like permease
MAGTARERAPARTPPTAALALYGATLTIALSSVLVRRAYLHGGTPEAVIVLRTGTPAVLLGVIVVIEALCGHAARFASLRSPAVLLRLVALGACLLGGSSGELYSLGRLQAPMTLLFFALAPVWIAVLSRVLYGTRLGQRRAAGLLVSLIGVVMIVGVPSGHIDPLGAAFALGGGLSASGSFLLLEGQLRVLPSRLVWAIALAEASLVSLAVHPSAPRDLAQHRDVLAMALAAGLLAGAAQLLATAGVRAVGAIVAGIATAMEPVNGAIIAWLVLGETLGPAVLLGAVVVLTGVFLTLSAPPLVRELTVPPAVQPVTDG